MPPPPHVETSELTVVSTKPSVIVKPLMVTVDPLETSKTRLALLPLTVSSPAPGPTIFRFLVTTSSPLVSLMVSPSRLGANAIGVARWR